MQTLGATADATLLQLWNASDMTAHASAVYFTLGVRLLATSRADPKAQARLHDLKFQPLRTFRTHPLDIVRICCQKCSEIVTMFTFPAPRY